MPTNPPLVWVIILAYNQAQYLPGAIESVLAQTCPHYEIMVVDDGSTDVTPHVAQQYGKAARYLRQENQGLAGACNTMSGPPAAS
jgi:glycosyltransferase involved in cell wall biosynthesis